MGKIRHFSHIAHPLTAATPNASLRCSLCKTIKCTSKGVYACNTCNYFLGSFCAVLEEQTNVPAHQQHPLTLTLAAATFRSCRACGARISGLRYSCSSCNYDLHALCALWPRAVMSSCHQHPLYLDFPAGPRVMSCNGCTHGDRGLWGYACTTYGCGHYLHLDCAAQIDHSRDPMDLLDQLLDAIETVVKVADVLENVMEVADVLENVVEVADGIQTVVDVASTTWDQTQLVPPDLSPFSLSAPTNVVNYKTSGDDDCDCGDDDCDDGDCSELPQLCC